MKIGIKITIYYRLVFDICVKSSALHGAEMGFKMSVIEEACRPLSQDNVETTKAELAEASEEQ